jgi:hypothetical protein
MVLGGNIGKLKNTLVFIILVVFFSCEKPVTGIIKCSECTSDEPVTAKLNIKLDKLPTFTTVNIYEGYLEDSVLFESFSTLSATITHNVPINKLYTITATYSSDAKYIVINSVTPRVLYDEVSCDEPCYYVYDRKVDLRLKYTR